MHYISTRGFGPVSFMRTLRDGLAPDGGLYVPGTYPRFKPEEIEEFTYLGYEDIAERVITPFIGDEIPGDELEEMIKAAYKGFNDIEVTPLLQYESDLWLQELYHGPSLAFKDIALQLFGQMLEWSLAQEKRQVTVLVATSGDTGPAAIAALSGLKNVNVVVLFPHNRTSQLQRLQMTTTGSKNVHPVAIEGTFDDCQAIVKALFTDQKLRDKAGLTAVNSISWARLLPQMVYYFFAYSRVRGIAGDRRPSFAIPTGNFGDAFAGYLAMQCGLPVERLLVATNSNDILTRFFNNGDYSTGKVIPTRAPSMDIQAASNFERLLFDIYGRRNEPVIAAMQAVADTGRLPPLSELQMDELRAVFTAHSTNDLDILRAISAAHATQGLFIDPHTAVALDAALARDDLRPMVVLATAHPGKFPTAVEAATGEAVPMPERLRDLEERDETCDQLPPDPVDVKKFILKQVG